MLSTLASLTISDLVRILKVNSNKWIKEENIFPLFENWQISYSAFTVSELDKDGLIEYIKNQETHHKTESFENELRRLLVKHNISFEEKYLF